MLPLSCAIYHRLLFIIAKNEVEMMDSVVKNIALHLISWQEKWRKYGKKIVSTVVLGSIILGGAYTYFSY